MIRGLRWDALSPSSDGRCSVRRSPVLIFMSMTMPIVQLVVLGYAFGATSSI